MSRCVRMLLRVRLLHLLADLLTSSRFVVEGESMAPALQAHQYLLVSRLVHSLLPPSRWDIVVLRDPLLPDVLCVKRVVGLPGEEVRLEQGHLLVNGAPVGTPAAADRGQTLLPATCSWLLGIDEYLVLGDNRLDSRDSRAFGPVRRDLIVGKAWLCYWPKERWRRVG